MPFFRSQSRRVWMATVAGALSLVVAVGCGYDTYELRLKQSADYFNYLERVEANLAAKYGDGRIILEMRVPKQFVPIPPPPPPQKREDGGEDPPPVDLRQPDYLTLILPQLVGAWEAPVEVSVAGGGRETRKAYIYALSNYWQLIGENPGEAQNFTKSVVELIGAALEQTPNETPESEMHPKPGTYVPTASYNVYRFKPKPITLQVEGGQASVNYIFEIYERQNGDIQCPLVVVVPEEVDSREKINERIPMMLDYFKPTKTPPRPGADKAAPAGGNAPVAF